MFNIIDYDIIIFKEGLNDLSAYDPKYLISSSGKHLQLLLPIYPRPQGSYE